MHIRVLIVDDHPVVRQGLRVLLEVQDGIEVVGEAGDGAAALALAAEQKPDVILLDLKLPGLDGLAVLAELRARQDHQAKILVLTSVTDPVAAGRAMREGAAGVLYKDVDPDALVRAIRAVHDGHLLLVPEAAGTLLRRPPGKTVAWAPSPPASARSWPNWPRAAPTVRSPAPCLSRRRRSRPMSARCWPSSACRTAPRPRCSRSATSAPPNHRA